MNASQGVHWSESILLQGSSLFLPHSGPQGSSFGPAPNHPHPLPPPPPPPLTHTTHPTLPQTHQHHHHGSTSQVPLYFSPQQPPPPPPRSNTSHPSSRRTSSVGDGSLSFLGPNLGVERSCSSGHEAGLAPARPPIYGVSEEGLTLAKLSQEVLRVEHDCQAQLHMLLSEVGKLKKDREVSWKHVVELKEQNQLLRDRLREREQPRHDLEAQNAALMAQNQSMATALNAIQERLGPLMALTAHLQQNGGQLPMIHPGHPTKSAVPHSVPHVPHSGADIW